MFAYAICIEGAPSFRFLQGRVAMLPTERFAPTASRMGPWFPPFANSAKDGASTCNGHASKIKRPCHPPSAR